MYEKVLCKTRTFLEFLCALKKTEPEGNFRDNQPQNLLRLFDILTKLPFTSREKVLDCYQKKLKV